MAKKKMAKTKPEATPNDEIDVEAIWRIARAAQRVEEIEEALALARRQWLITCAKSRAMLKATIESSGSVEPYGAKARLDAILDGQQQADDDDAGRKVALHDILSQRKHARARLIESFASARQLELDGVALSDDEPEEASAAPYMETV